MKPNFIHWLRNIIADISPESEQSCGQAKPAAADRRDKYIAYQQLGTTAETGETAVPPRLCPIIPLQTISITQHSRA